MALLDMVRRRTTSVALGALRTWLDPQLARAVAIDKRQLQDGTFKKGLHRPNLSAIIPNLTAAGSHPDCRAVLIQIVALYPRTGRE